MKHENYMSAHIKMVHITVLPCVHSISTGSTSLGCSATHFKLLTTNLYTNEGTTSISRCRDIFSLVSHIYTDKVVVYYATRLDK